MKEISQAEYLNAKHIVDTYEMNEMMEGLNDAMFCTSCQAFLEQECVCDNLDEDVCNYCSGDEDNHAIGCPRDGDYH